METIAQEKTTVTTQKTNLKDVVVVRYYAPHQDKDFSVYLDIKLLCKINSVQDAEKIMLKKGFHAYPKKTTSMLEQGIPLPTDQRFVDANKKIIHEQLLIQSNYEDGFIYQFGCNIPLNMPLKFNLFNISNFKNLQKHIKKHPQLSLHKTKKTCFTVQIILSDKQFNHLYQQVQGKYYPHLYYQKMVEALRYPYANYPDILGLQTI